MFNLLLTMLYICVRYCISVLFVTVKLNPFNKNTNILLTFVILFHVFLFSVKCTKMYTLLLTTRIE